MRKAFLLPFLLMAFSAVMSISAFGQGQPAASKIDDDFVKNQFGNQFTMLSEIQPVIGDLDGDGAEDVAIAARCKNPMLDQSAHGYIVVDPYDDFYGYGDPKITTTFSEAVPERRGLVVLIIHGKGPEGWHAATPKAKFVIVNLPYKGISVRKMKLRKKTVDAVYIEESGDTGESSALFFDGKKFKYVPMGGDME
jgi:hypothetical protein